MLKGFLRVIRQKPSDSDSGLLFLLPNETNVFAFQCE